MKKIALVAIALSIISASLGLLFSSCAAKNKAAQESIPKAADMQYLSNDDIAWEGNYIGLNPVLNEVAEKILNQLIDEQRLGKNDIRNNVMSLLEDQNRFVVAHVLLTRSSIGGSYSVSATQWNGLHVELLGNGVTQIDVSQMTAIKKRWAAASR